jgi:limonene-1,2-epoxide hydrolase
MTMPFLSPSQTVRLFLKAMETLNYSEAVKYVADDCEYSYPAPLGSVRAAAGARGPIEPLFASKQENEFKIVRESQNSSVVFVERLDQHLLADKWVELPMTGVFEVHDGLITFWRDYFDTATIMSQWPVSKEA